jgi:hypothetical protein
MPVPLSVLGAASDGPAPGPNSRPNMLSIGDSLMWGQGLRPDHRFRELVRRRIAREGTPVVELSMARSGAQIDPANPQHSNAAQTQDGIIADTFLNSSTPAPIYAPSLFAREVPHSSLTSVKQLEVARDLLRHGPDSAPADINWIILDGGINDVNVVNIVSPAGAISDGEVLEGWSAWLLERARTETEPEMISTLDHALQWFPNAAIVVNGYFPIFSIQSMVGAIRVTSYGVLNAGLSAAVLGNPASLMAIAEASRVWQIVSNEHLRRAIARITSLHPRRRVMFARSNIEDSHCLFAPQTWLWGYSASPPTVPANLSEWIQWFAGAAPEDEVIVDRLARCAALQPSGLDGAKCRLASIGHPNPEGATDYANAIIEAMEDGGVIPSHLDACALADRRRRKACIERQDRWDYWCVARNANMARTCGRILSGLRGTLENQAERAGKHLSDAGRHLTAAGDCLGQAIGTLAQSARDQLSAAEGDVREAGNQLTAALNCWNEAAEDLRRCEDAEAQDRAGCDAAYDSAVAGACSIWCTSFGNCNSFGRFNPYRYVCRGLRAACVAAAATMRGACIAAVWAVREACRGEAAARATLCKGGVVVGDAVCSVAHAGLAAGSLAMAGGRALVGLGSAGITLGNGVGCATGEVGRAGFDAFVAGVGVTLGIGWDLGVIGAYGLCRGTEWVLNKACRLGSAGANALCQTGAAGLAAACQVVREVRATARP